MSWIFRLEGFSGVYALISSVTEDCFENPVVISILKVFQIVGLPLVAFGILVLLLKTLLSLSDGERVNMVDTGKRCVFGIIVYVYGVEIMKLFYFVILDTSQKLLNAVAGITSVEMDGILNIFEIGLVSIVVLILMLYYMFKTFLNLCERFWQLLVMLCMLYIYLPSYITGDDESITLWFKQCIAIILTQVFQSVLLCVGMSMYIQSGALGDLFITTGAMVASSKIEQLLDRYGLAVGGKLGGVARNGMSVAFYAKSILRR